MDDLDAVVGWEPLRQSRWLRGDGPAADRSAFWWRRAVSHATAVATDHQKSRVVRRRWVGLAVLCIESAHDVGVLGDDEAVIRMANLAVTLQPYGQPEEFDPVLEVGRVVRRCLDEIPISIQEAEQHLLDWRTLPVESIYLLRRAKNIVASFAPLVDRLTDSPLKNLSSEWRVLLPRLP